jgi:hypothetical protein
MRKHQREGTYEQSTLKDTVSEERGDYKNAATRHIKFQIWRNRFAERRVLLLYRHEVYDCALRVSTHPCMTCPWLGSKRRTCGAGLVVASAIPDDTNAAALRLPLKTRASRSR